MPLSSGFGSENESIVFDQAGNAYIGYAGTNQIRKVNSNGAQLATFTVQSNTDWIDLAADQSTLLYSDESGTIRRWNAGGNVPLSNFVSSVAVQFYAKRYRPNGEVLVAGSDGFVYRYDANGVLIAKLAAGIGSVFALNLDPDGTSVWTGSTGGTAVRKLDIATGATLASWSTGTGTLFGLSVLGEIQAGGGGVNDMPEPVTFALCGGGLLALVVLRLRRA